jgi:hypothetical protein
MLGALKFSLPTPTGSMRWVHQPRPARLPYRTGQNAGTDAASGYLSALRCRRNDARNHGLFDIADRQGNVIHTHSAKQPYLSTSRQYGCRTEHKERIAPSNAIQ